MHKLQRSWVRSQHPSAQWNLRGGRWSSAEYCKGFWYKKTVDKCVIFVLNMTRIRFHLRCITLSPHTANPVWFIYSRKSFSIESIPICNYMFLNRIMTFHRDSFSWAGSSNVRQKHIFPNRIIKVQLENYNSFLNYKLFPGLKNLLKEKKHNFKILNLYWKKNSQHIVITLYIKGKEMHHWHIFHCQI
jgi:hypothetical protein